MKLTPLRKVLHPGPAAPLRLAHVSARGPRALRLVMPPGVVLQDALTQACEAAGVRAAAITLFGGTLGSLAWCLPVPGHANGVVATYGEPLRTMDVRLLAGSATLGRAADGTPLVHCHASFCDAAGQVRGGHLLTDQTVVGAEPVIARISALDGVDLCLGLDPETGLNKLMPAGCTDNV